MCIALHEIVTNCRSLSSGRVAYTVSPILFGIDRVRLRLRFVSSVDGAITSRWRYYPGLLTDRIKCSNCSYFYSTPFSEYQSWTSVTMSAKTQVPVVFRATWQVYLYDVALRYAVTNKNVTKFGWQYYEHKWQFWTGAAEFSDLCFFLLLQESGRAPGIQTYSSALCCTGDTTALCLQVLYTATDREFKPLITYI